MSINISKPILDDEIMTVVVHKLTGRCYPYGSTSIDADRKSNLKVKIAVAESLLAEIIEAGKLYDRPEYSIQDISNTANQWLVDMRDWLNDIDYLPKEAIQDDWIPVSERLPEELEEVLVCVTHNGKSKMAVSCRRDYNYWDSWGRDIIGEMAWMPLPDAYEGGDTE